MWHLIDPQQSELDDYVSWLIEGVKKRINERRSDPTYQEWCNYLLPIISMHPQIVYDERLIKEILIAKPNKLFKLNTKHLNTLLQRKQPVISGRLGHTITYSERQLRHYILAKTKRNRTPKQSLVVQKYDSLFEFLLDVFDYGLIKEKIAYKVAKLKDVNTCTYCNRQYTFTIGRKKTGGKTVSKIKPQFDHWFAHKQYPLLSLSFFNLIPCCSVCNSSVKGSIHYSLKTHVHPYLSSSFDPNFTFLSTLVYDQTHNKDRWSVILKRNAHSLEDETIKALCLDDVYDKHGELEVKDIMDFKLKNNPTYLRNLFATTCLDMTGVYTQADVYRMLFGVEADIDKTLNRPFSKLKRDILKAEGIEI